MSLRTPLKRARGLGSAKDGTTHWWLQRVTAVALIPLLLWFVVSLVRIVGADYAHAVAWLRMPVNTTLSIILMVTLLHHAQLGMQVVFEDYCHVERVKIVSIVLMKFLAVLLGVIAVVSILRVAFGS
jgi:succinate dehydrogenase / fumarate reductase, membrane anchor subunit